MIESLDNRDKKTLTYKEYLKSKYRNLITLAREMEKSIGKEKAHEIIRNAFYDNMTDSVKEELKELGPVREFADFIRMEKEENEHPNFKNIVELTYPYETETELSLNVTKCLHAEVFKELDATELGYLIVCHPDHAYAQACNPRMKLKRSVTLMQGGSHCNHVWFWDESEN